VPGEPEIVKFWRACDLAHPPFVHPEDLGILSRRDRGLLQDLPDSLEAFIASSRFGRFTDHRFHFSLVPKPYDGDLNRADIFVLQLNPGFNPADYHAEWEMPEYRKRLERSVRQELDGLEFPFVALDPQFCWQPGFRWWERKLRDVATTIAERKYQGRYIDALRELSRRMAVVELVPYHSIAFDERGLIRVLPSAEQGIRFVQDDLLKRVSSGTAIAIAVRKVSAWGLREIDLAGLITYSAGQSRGSSFGPQTPGGRAILVHFGIELPGNE